MIPYKQNQLPGNAIVHPEKCDSESIGQLLLVVRDGTVEYPRCKTFNQVIGEVNKLHGGTHLVWFGANRKVKLHFDI